MKLCFAAISTLCKDKVRVKPELKLTVSLALTGVPSAADNGNNEKSTHSTPGAMNKRHLKNFKNH